MQSAVKYYNVNKILMSKLGVWPTQSIPAKIILPAIPFTFLFCIGYLEFVKLSETWRNLTDDCESCIVVLLSIGAYIKLFILILNSKNVKHLLRLIDYHWCIFTHSLEVQVMYKYTTIGRKMTISYTVTIYSLMSLYMLIPVTPQILDFLMPLNKSRPYKYLFNIDYSFDREEYYYFTLFHSYLTTVFAVTVMVVCDTSYMMLAQHACGLFAAIGHRLENLTSMTLKKNNSHVAKVACDKCESTNYENRNYREIVLLVRKHQLCLEYVDLLESLFVFYSFLMLFLHIIVMSLLGVQIMSLMDGHKEEMIRYVSMVIGGFFHLLVLSYPAQEIMDHSEDIFYKTYNMLWYKMSHRTTQLLSILLYRSFVPCTLTAGKMYVLSFQNYASVMQGTLSYFTALSSFG